MSTLKDLVNPPPTQGQIQDFYKFFNSTYTSLNALTSIRNASVLTNANFATLSGAGLTPTTPGDGDNFEFIQDWFVVGATAANYVITPTVYPSNSTIASASDYFVSTVVTSANGNPFYFYQRQPGTVRQYQRNYLTYGLIVNNNQSKPVQLRMDIFTYYDPGSLLVAGGTFFLQPGLQMLTSKLLTQTLFNVSVGAGNYTEFRFNFFDLIDGTADIDLYQIKCEFGQIGTPL